MSNGFLGQFWVAGLPGAGTVRRGNGRAAGDRMRFARPMGAIWGDLGAGWYVDMAAGERGQNGQNRHEPRIKPVSNRTRLHQPTS